METKSNLFSIRIVPVPIASGLPAWVPVPGKLKSVHANELTSLNPCAGNNCWYSESSGQNGPWVNWCGAVFASDYSEFGAMVYWGGGHGGYDGVEAYVFDLTTQMWSRIGEPIPYDFLPETSADWCDVLYKGQHVPPASHTYSHPVYISRANGGGAKGSFCLPYNVYGGGPGSGNGSNGYRPHLLDLASGTWSRWTTNTMDVPASYGPYGGSFIDAKRNVFWGMAATEGQSAVKVDLNKAVKTFELVTNVGAPTMYFVPIHVPEKDMAIASSIYGNGEGVIAMTGFDLSGGKPVPFAIKFAVPQICDIRFPGISIDWCPDTGKFYLYVGLGTSKLYVATPPSSGDWKNGTWTWSIETMGGEVPVNALEVAPGAQGVQPFTKWKYNRKLKCFMWSQGTVSRMSPDGKLRSGAFQLYRPLGT